MYYDGVYWSQKGNSHVYQYCRSSSMPLFRRINSMEFTCLPSLSSKKSKSDGLQASIEIRK